MKIGTMELIVILLIAFLVLGPDKTLAYTRKIGKGLRTLKVYVNSFTDDIKETVTDPLSDLAEPLNDLAKPFDDMAKSVQKPIDELNATVRQSEYKLNSPSKPKTATAAATAAPVVEELEEAVPIEEAIPVETDK